MNSHIVLRLSLAGMVLINVAAGASNAAEKNDERRQLAKARLEVAHKGFESAGLVGEMLTWSERILVSELALCENRDQRIAALEGELRRAEKIENTAFEGKKQGNFTSEEVLNARYYRLDTQLKLATEKAKKTVASNAVP